jgi:hypothetical protein
VKILEKAKIVEVADVERVTREIAILKVRSDARAGCAAAAAVGARFSLLRALPSSLTRRVLLSVSSAMRAPHSGCATRTSCNCLKLWTRQSELAGGGAAQALLQQLFRRWGACGYLRDPV